MGYTSGTPITSSNISNLHWDGFVALPPSPEKFGLKKKTPQTNLQWLNQRVEEMRIRL